MKYISIVFLILLCFNSLSQELNISGKITENNNSAISSACIKLVDEDLKIIGFTYSNNKGRYQLCADSSKNLKIIVSCLGFKTVERKLNKKSIYNIKLQEETIILNDVAIQAKSSVLIKKDTITYRLDAFRDSSELVIEDILKKVPHMQIDYKGEIYYKGKKIDKVLIDDDDLLGSKYKLATRNLDSKTVSEIEIINNYSDKRIEKDFKESSQMALNLKFDSKSKNVILAKISSSYSNRNQYALDGFVSRISNRDKLFIYGRKNNINGDIGDPFRMNIDKNPYKFNYKTKIDFNNYIPDIDINRMKFDRDRFYSATYLKKFAKYTKLKLDVSRSCSNVFFKRNMKTDFFYNNQSFSVEKNMELEKDPSKYKFVCDFRHEKENYSLFLNSFGNFQKNKSFKNSNNGTLIENINDKGYNIFNRINFLSKKGNLLAKLSLNTDNCHNNQNYSLNIFNTQQDAKFDYSKYHLKLNLSSFTEKMKYSLIIGSYYKFDKFKTKLNLKIINPINDLHLESKVFYCTPKFSYKYGSIHLITNFNFRYTKNSIEDFDKKLPSKSNFYFLPDVRFSFNLNGNSFYLGLKSELNNLSSSNIHPNFLLVGDRFFEKYKLSYDVNKKMTYTFSYNLFSYYKYIELNLISSIINNSKSLYADIHLDKNFNYKEFSLIPKPSNTYLSSIKLRKFFPLISCNITSMVTYIKSSFYNSVNSKLPCKNDSDNYYYKIAFNSVLFPYCNFNLGSEYKISKYKHTSSNIEKENSKLDFYLKLKSNFSKKIHVNFFINRSILGLNEKKSSSISFIDLNLKYILNRHFVLSLNAYNLTNEKDYLFFTSNDYSTYRETSSLVPRSIILKFTYNI